MGSSMKEYLKKYMSDDTEKKKKKKKKKSKNPAKEKNFPSGVRVVDEDPVWQVEVKEDPSEEEDSPDEKPQIIEDVEVKRLRRLEQMKMHRPYLAVADDGSGWVTISEPMKAADEGHVTAEGASRKSPASSPSKNQALKSSPDSSPPRKHALKESADLSPLRKTATLNEYENKKSVGGSPVRKGDIHKRVRHDSPDSLQPMKATRNNEYLSPQHDSADLSPLRKSRGKRVQHDSPNSLPSREVARNMEYLSPQHDSPHLSPHRKASGKRVRHDSPDSLPLRKVASNMEDLSTRPPDLSPPRRASGRRVRHDSPDSLPPRKVVSNMKDLSSRHHSPDLSPPRKASGRRVRHDSPDLLPPRKVVSNMEDLSPQHDSLDLSPPRKASGRRVRHDSPDSLPPRKVARNMKDLSLRHDSPDISPPRKVIGKRVQHDSLGQVGRNMEDLSPQHDSPDLSPPRKASGKNKSENRVGLLSGKALKEEIERKRQEENERVLGMDASVSGRNAETIYRDKHGRRLEGADEYMKLHKRESKPEDKPLEWGKGIAQKREAEARLAELEKEKNKPFARSRDDPDLDKMLRERVRWGDPMAHLAKNKIDEPVLEDLAEDEKMKESGFIIPQEIPNHSWIKRGVDPPANRYGIKPGRHWDGVDRSNGFEKELFKRQNEKKATETEAYLWSVADM